MKLIIKSEFGKVIFTQIYYMKDDGIYYKSLKNDRVLIDRLYVAEPDFSRRVKLLNYLEKLEKEDNPDDDDIKTSFEWWADE